MKTISHQWTEKTNGVTSIMKYEVIGKFSETATTQVVDVNFLGCFENGERLDYDYKNHFTTISNIKKLILDRVSESVIGVINENPLEVGGSFKWVK